LERRVAAFQNALASSSGRLQAQRIANEKLKERLSLALEHRLTAKEALESARASLTDRANGLRERLQDSEARRAAAVAEKQALQASVNAMSKDPVGAYLTRSLAAKALVDERLSGQTFDAVFVWDYYLAFLIDDLRARFPEARFIFDGVDHPDAADRAQRSDGATARQAILRTAIRESLNRFDTAIASSDGQSAARRRFGVRPPGPVLPLGLDHAAAGKTDYYREYFALGPADVIVVCQNTAYNEAGAEDLVGAFAHLDARHHLVFQGRFPGDAEQRIDRAAKILGLGPRVHKAPPASHGALTAWLSSADLAVMSLRDPSEQTRQALPNALFDAISARLPLAAPAGSAAGDAVLEHGLGEAFAAADRRGLADGVARTTAGARDGRYAGALDAAAARFDWRAMFSAAEAEIMAGAGDRVLYLIDRPIRFGDKPYRTIRSLAESGREVTVAALKRPDEAGMEADVRYTWPQGSSPAPAAVRAEAAE